MKIPARWNDRTAEFIGTKFAMIPAVDAATKEQTMNETFRYDLAAFNEPRIILITELTGKRSELPRLGTVVLPQPRR